VLKATPQVHGKLVTLDYDLTVRAVGATQAAGPPLLTNRESKGTISTEDGQPVVVAGLVSKSEMAAINGIPVLSAVPILGKAFSVETKEKADDDLLIVITPHITDETNARGLYLPIPTNVPK
jgi:Flp pilus assembly secretin CpaC